MKTNPSFILRDIAGDSILIPTGKAAQNFNGVITLNETAQFIWKNIDTAESPAALAALVMENYEVDQKTAYRDVCGILTAMYRAGMIHV